MSVPEYARSEYGSSEAADAALEIELDEAADRRGIDRELYRMTTAELLDTYDAKGPKSAEAGRLIVSNTGKSIEEWRAYRLEYLAGVEQRNIENRIRLGIA